MTCVNLSKFKTELEDLVPEKTLAYFTGTLVDEKGVVIPSSSMSSLVLTLYNNSTEEIINSRDTVDVLNTNGGTVDAVGKFTLSLNASDNVILGISDKEVHVILLEWSWSLGTKTGKHKILFTLFNLTKVT